MARCSAGETASDKTAPLFRTVAGKTGKLTDRRMTRTDALCMIWRRALAAGIETELRCHSFRATGITVNQQNGGLLDNRSTLTRGEFPNGIDAVIMAAYQEGAKAAMQQLDASCR